MKKLLRYSLTLVFALVASVGFAATYTYSFTEKVFGKSGETVDLGGIEWTATSAAGYFGFDTTDAKKGQQFGSKKKPATTLTLSTAAFKDKITAITVETAGASGINATLDVTVGGKAFGKQYTQLQQRPRQNSRARKLAKSFCHTRTQLKLPSTSLLSQ